MARTSQNLDQLRASEPAVLEALLASRSRRKAVVLPFRVPYILLPVFDDDGVPQIDLDSGEQKEEELYFECTPVEGSIIDDCIRKSTKPNNPRPSDHELNCRAVVAATTEYYRKKWWANPQIRNALGVGENWMVVDALLEPGDVQRATTEILRASGYQEGSRLEQAKSPGGADRNGRDE